MRREFPCLSSPRFCRPIRFRFVKETAEVTIEEINIIKEQIERLKSTEVPVEGGVISVQHDMQLSMVDAKVCNSLTNFSYALRCYICSATSSDFNSLPMMYAKEVNLDTFEFGLSVLHARIRFLDFVLHLSYKLPTSVWQARTDEERAGVAETKKMIQDASRATFRYAQSESR